MGIISRLRQQDENTDLRFPEVAPMSGKNQTKSETPWFLVQLKPNGFKRAKMNLYRQGIATFMPLSANPPLNGSTHAIRPLFPGYLFVSFDPLKVSFSKINSTYGVSQIVTTGSEVQLGLSPELILGLRARCDQHDIILPVDDLKVSEVVRITSGPFSRFVAVVDKLKDSERVQILFDIMGQSVRSDIAIKNLDRVP